MAKIYEKSAIGTVLSEAWLGNSVISAETLNGSEERIMKLVEERIKESAKVQDVIVKCEYCGQWGALKTPCHKCGAPVG